MNRNQGRGGIGFGGLPIGMVVSGIAAGIGLSSESIHHHKEKKAAKEAAKEAAAHAGESPPAYQEAYQERSKNEKDLGQHTFEEGDEEQWDLDDAQGELIPEPSVEQKRKLERDPKKITQHFIERHPAPQCLPAQKLPLPVILPQRRPKNRMRGFIRAYAPDLANCGIDEAMFLDFLETFNEASVASPWLNAINLAGLAFFHLPTGISQAASLGLMLTVHVAKHLQSRARYDFLARIIVRLTY
jgi:hypothetical protein